MMSDDLHEENIQQDAALSASEVDNILRKYDKTFNIRAFAGPFAKVVSVLLILFSVFQLVTSTVITLDAILLRALHLGFGLFLIFLFYPMTSRWHEKIHPLDVAFSFIALSCSLYLVINYRAIVLRAGLISQTDLVVGVIMFILVLEAVRRVVGWPMVILSLIFMLYAFYGRLVPGRLAHRGISFGVFIQHQFFSTEGILGLPIGVSSTFIFLFLLFGAFLEKTGMGEFFMDLTNSIAGNKPGGPAKVAVLSSALMGTLSGSSVANVVGTGSFTIPMMKRLGYRPEFAGAVEAAASTGGQLMPPIMGSAAFIMAEFTNTPYLRIITAAAIPAVLYYFGIWAGVHYEALKHGLLGLPKEQLKKTSEVLKSRGHLLLPILVVLYLLIDGFSPAYAALGAIVAAIVCSMFKKSTRMSLRDFLNGLENGARSALSIIAPCACAGIIIGVVTQTGLGLKVGSTLVAVAGGNLMLTLMFTMVTSLILGIGVPTTANYVITSVIAAPALLALNVPVLAAHMFVFYFGIIADITPPVCLAAVAGAGVAKAEPMRTGVNATRLAIAAFVVPYIFVYSPELILIHPHVLHIVYAIVTAVIGMFLVASGLTGYFVTNMNILERVIFVASGITLLTTPYLLNFAAGVVAAAAVFIQYRKRSRAESAA
ncbi:MAG: TRAP transporter permease [Synergistaceae bacterium]|jgi:TRAP transporter 4TM/12TM fusion protein|nr:TRAP transporter permease [Synergistaceae bacterium]